jgi:hypothetical protein
VASAESPIDWRRAEQIATRISGRHADVSTTEFVDFSDVIPTLEDQIESTTGLRSLAGPAVVAVIDRRGSGPTSRRSSTCSRR